MKTEIVIRYIGHVLLFCAIFMGISASISAIYHETSFIPLLFSALITALLGLFPMVFVKRTDTINSMEGLMIVVFGWLAACLTGMLPFMMWGGEFHPVNAWFESVSGFTTTGSSILTEIESLPRGLLFWRSATHWLGGMGVILFALLILPQASVMKVILLHTEISTLAKANFAYRARKTLQILALVYIGLTLLETILLTLFGMSIFDAVNHSFATIATGGFSTRNNSVATFGSISIEVIIMAFMLISGIHFGLIFQTVTLNRKSNIFRSTLARNYLLFIFAGILLVTAKLWADGMYDLKDSLRYGAFQVISLGTTTGFATADTNPWPFFTQIILIYFTIQCAMAGSTSGGLKFDRVFIFLKSIGRQMKQIRHPRAVFTTTIDGKVIDASMESMVTIFIGSYMLILLISTIGLSLFDIDLFSAFTASAATLGNVGPGFNRVSSLGNFANLPSPAKLILTINMILGRLEIFGIFTILFARSWRK
ncbi:MAG: potassium transporter TrkG [Bacteroidales bacterium]